MPLEMRSSASATVDKDRMRIRFLAIIAILCGVAGLISCGSSGSSTSNATQLAGNWQFTLQRASNPLIQKMQAGFLLQKGNTVTGSLLFTVGNTCTGLGNLTGTVNGNSVSFVVSQTAQTVTMSGTADASGKTMSGTYTTLAQGCGVSETGNWTATQVPAVTGTFSGMLSSLVDGSTASVSANITQGPNTGESVASISGTLNTQSACFSTGSVTGTIGGTQMIWNILASDGSQLGQIVMTLSTDANNPNGKYGFNSQTQFPPGTPCRFGDHGLVTIPSQ
jgi:hypothetical protein